MLLRPSLAVMVHVPSSLTWSTVLLQYLLHWYYAKAIRLIWLTVDTFYTMLNLEKRNAIRKFVDVSHLLKLNAYTRNSISLPLMNSLFYCHSYYQHQLNVAKTYYFRGNLFRFFYTQLVMCCSLHTAKSVCKCVDYFYKHVIHENMGLSAYEVRCIIRVITETISMVGYM